MNSLATESRAQLVDQTVKITTNHERYQREVAQRRKAEKMLGEIKSRLVLLTQSKICLSLASTVKSRHKPAVWPVLLSAHF